MRRLETVGTSAEVTPAGIDIPFRGVVAVDGPSGSGKSSVCREVARRLRIRYLDTGAMYRAVTWAALDRGIDLDDQAAVAALGRKLALDIRTDPTAAGISVDGVDVSSAIRETRISEVVSAVATNRDVRADLVARQRLIIDRYLRGDADNAHYADRSDRPSVPGRGTVLGGGSAAELGAGIVAEGRDITTVVAPDADVRILLTADERARVARRALELHGSDDASALAATSSQVIARDAKDATVVDFHSAADGVRELDTSDLSFDEVVDAVLAMVAAAGRRVGSGRAR
jgi:cytidylate kinase